MGDALQAHTLDVELFRRTLTKMAADEHLLAKLREAPTGRLAWDRLQRAEKRQAARRRLRGRRWREGGREEERRG